MPGRDFAPHSFTHRGFYVSKINHKGFTMPVTVYTRTTCAPCQTVKSFLRKKGVEYRELNVDEDPSLMDEIVARTGLQMVPTTIVGDQIIQGMNFSLLSKALMV